MNVEIASRIRGLIAWLPAPLRFEHVPRQVLLVSAYAALNLGLGMYFVRLGPGAGDWQLWLTVPDMLARGDLYGDPLHQFVWSPVAAWLMAGVIQLGYWTWFALHVAAVFVIRSWSLIGLTFLTWPFWHDTAEGNVMTFIFVSGALALGGSRVGTLIYLVLLVLMPRPVQVPLALWLLWRMPEVRWPFAALFVGHFAVVLASGYGTDWIEAVRAYGTGGAMVNTIGPPRWLGFAWLVIGIPLGLWLWRQGRLGLAGIALSPYWLPGYLLMWLIEFVPRHAARSCPSAPPHARHDDRAVVDKASFVPRLRSRGS